MNRFRCLWIVLAIGVLWSHAVGAAGKANPMKYTQIEKFSYEDFSWVDRTLKKPPAFKSEKVRYSIWVLGNGKKSVMVMAWDESQGTGKGYDALYADVNLNGDLTDEGERFFWENVATKAKKKKKNFEFYEIKGVKESGGGASFSFKLGNCYRSDELYYPMSIGARFAKGGYGVGCLPGRTPLQWSNDLKTAPVYRLGGEAVPVLNGRIPGKDLGTWRVGRGSKVGYSTGLMGSDAKAMLKLNGSRLGPYANIPSTLLRVRDKDGKFMEDIAFTGGCG